MSIFGSFSTFAQSDKPTMFMMVEWSHDSKYLTFTGMRQVPDKTTGKMSMAARSKLIFHAHNCCALVPMRARSIAF